MRVTQHHITSRPGFRTLFAGGALLMALMVSGCSAVNMTGFSFPVFGLSKSSDELSDARTTASVPAVPDQNTYQFQKLSTQ